MVTTLQASHGGLKSLFTQEHLLFLAGTDFL